MIIGDQITQDEWKKKTITLKLTPNTTVLDIADWAEKNGGQYPDIVLSKMMTPTP